MDNIFDSTAEALVNPVNCVGVMGKGLAREFRIRHPYMFLDYKGACTKGLLQPGGIHYYYDRGSNKLIYNVATKEHWRDPAKLEWVQLGLTNLRKYLIAERIRSVAVPALGCGLGGLEWDDVKPMIELYLNHPDIRAEIYPPGGEMYQL